LGEPPGRGETGDDCDMHAELLGEVMSIELSSKAFEFRTFELGIFLPSAAASGDFLQNPKLIIANLFFLNMLLSHEGIARGSHGLPKVSHGPLCLTLLCPAGWSPLKRP
jgi:hypothetical protein